MELEIKEQSKNKIIFEITGEDHTFSNLLRDKLWDQKGVITSGYNIKHPLVGKPKFIVETEGSINVKDVLLSASKDVMKDLKNFEKSISSL